MNSASDTMPPRDSPSVVILGRPNVGKSTLFNRLARGRRALVHDRPGVTRDLLFAPVDWDGRRFTLVDMGGVEGEATVHGLDERIRGRALEAIRRADLVLCVFDGRTGILPGDEELARRVARSGRPVLCVVNKIDAASREERVYEYFRLGLGEPLGVSAEHGRGVAELLDAVIATLDLPPSGVEPARDDLLRVALIGRPNAGKSSLLNRIVGQERSLVDPSPGTTRDAIDMIVEAGGRRTLLVDTAGMRRRSRVQESVERLSVSRAVRSIERAHVVVLVIDAGEGMSDQDARLARLVQDRGRALVVVLNKWDHIPHGQQVPARFARELRGRYRHLQHIPILCVSALRGTGTSRILPAAHQVGEAFRQELPTRRLNELIEAATSEVDPPIVHGKRAKLYYATSIGRAPPTIAIFVNDPERIPSTYLRYLENRIRQAFSLEGTPLRIRLRRRQRTARLSREESG